MMQSPILAFSPYVVGTRVPDLGVDGPVCAEQIVTGAVIGERQVVPEVFQGTFIEHGHALKAVHTHGEILIVELLQKEVPLKAIAAPGNGLLDKVDEQLPIDDEDAHAGQIFWPAQ